MLHILVYHGINKDNADRFTVTPAMFDAQMAWLQANAYDVIPLADGVRRLAQGTTNTKTVALTFDDGYADFLDHAAPVLRRYGLPATLFVVAGKVGSKVDWPQGPQGRPLLSWSALRDVVATGCAIGSHSLTHPRLSQLGHRQLQVELLTSRDLIEQKLGMPVPAFSYPYGVGGPREREAVNQAGYGCGCGLQAWRRTGRSDPFALPRLELWSGYSLFEFQAMLTARVNWPRWVRAAKHLWGATYDDRVHHYS